MSATDPQAQSLQDCLDRIAAGESVEDVLAHLGDEPELAKIVRLSAHMAELLPTTPRPAFRGQLQATLQERVAPTPTRRSGVRLWPRLLPRLVALVAAVAVAMGSAVVASADSLPGDALYPVKLATEQTRLALAAGGSARVLVHLDIADHRLAEIQALVDRGMTPQAAVIERLVNGLADAEGAALEEAQQVGDASLVQTVLTNAQDAGQAVDALIPALPDSVRPALERVRDRLAPPAERAPEPTSAPVVATARIEPTNGLAAESTPTGTTESVVAPLTLPPTATATVGLSLTATPTVGGLTAPPTEAPAPTVAVLPPTPTTQATTEQPAPAMTPTPSSGNPIATERAATLTAEVKQTEEAKKRTPTPKPTQRRGRQGGGGGLSPAPTHTPPSPGNVAPATEPPSAPPAPTAAGHP